MYNRIDAGEFDNKLPYVTHKKDPAAHEAYNREEERLYSFFRSEAEKDLSEEFPVFASFSAKQRESIFSKVWEDGHASDFSEIFSEMRELVMFLSEFLNKN